MTQPGIDLNKNMATICKTFALNIVHTVFTKLTAYLLVICLLFAGCAIRWFNIFAHANHTQVQQYHHVAYQVLICVGLGLSGLFLLYFVLRALNLKSDD